MIDKIAMIGEGRRKNFFVCEAQRSKKHCLIGEHFPSQRAFALVLFVFSERNFAVCSLHFAFCILHFATWK